MARRECDRSENIVRAITTAYWDAEEQRPQSSLFRGPETSVSRLKVLDLKALFEIFRRDLERNPPTLLMAGEINVGVLQDLGQSYKDKPTKISVEEVPLPNNPAHAEIPQKLSRGLANTINQHLKLHPAP